MEVGDHYVVTGGYDWTLGTNSALAWVTRYTEAGGLETLPSLNAGRYDHACSSFVNDGGHTVSSSSLSIDLFSMGHFEAHLRLIDQQFH